MHVTNITESWRVNRIIVGYLWTKTTMSLKLKAVCEPKNPESPNESPKRQRLDLGDESQVEYIPRFLSYDEAWKIFDYLNNQIPWTRPTIRVFGRSCLQVFSFLSHYFFIFYF